MSTYKSFPASSETDGDHLDASLQSHHSVTTLSSPVLSERLSAESGAARASDSRSAQEGANFCDEFFFIGRYGDNSGF